jgi:ribonuclease BN (tRNA processing enzyme)
MGTPEGDWRLGTVGRGTLLRRLWTISGHYGPLGQRTGAVVLSHGHWDHAGGLVEAIGKIVSSNGGKPVLCHVNQGMFQSRAIKLPDGGSRATTAAFLLGWTVGHTLRVEAQVPSQRAPFTVGTCFLPLDGAVRTIIEVKEVAGTWLRTTDSTVAAGAVWINTQALGAIQSARCRV